MGLALFRDGRFRTVNAAGAEPFGTVTGIIETADGSLWLNEMRGVVRIPPEEVRRAVEEPGHAVAFRRFDFLDGLRGAAQMNWTASTAVEAGDGRLWFATDNGLVWIDPAHMLKNEVPPPVLIRVFLIGQEALVNAFRHSRADHIKVEVGYAGHHLRVSVSDDGRGIEPQVLRAGREGHWGLSGMRERAERIGGRLKLQSHTGAGTRVELTVPGHIAYSKGSLAREAGWLNKLLRRRAGIN